MKRIKWIEDKSKNYRSNFTSMVFKFNNSNYIFEFNATMSYKTFKSLVRELAKKYEAQVVKIAEYKGQSNMTIRYDGETINFFQELEVPKGSKRQFKHFNERDIFQMDRLYRAEYEDENFEIFNELNDEDALHQAWDYEEAHGSLFNLFEIDDDCNELRTII